MGVAYVLREEVRREAELRDGYDGCGDGVGGGEAREKGHGLGQGYGWEVCGAWLG